MTYIDELAGEIRREVPPQLIPKSDTTVLFRIYAVLALAKGEGVSLGDVHDAWSAWMSDHDPEHPSLKPLGELDHELQLADQPYVDAIRTIARSHDVTR